MQTLRKPWSTLPGRCAALVWLASRLADSS